jgi:hypothetical protein
MSVSLVSATGSSAATRWVEPPRKIAAQQTRTTEADASPEPVKADFSRLAQMLAKLDNLAKSDPRKFAVVTAEIAAQLAAVAKGTSGNAPGLVDRLAAQFTAASQSGDVSSLEPPQPSKRGYDQSSAAAMTAAAGSSGVMDGVFAAVNAL